MFGIEGCRFLEWWALWRGLSLVLPSGHGLLDELSMLEMSSQGSLRLRSSSLVGSTYSRTNRCWLHFPSISFHAWRATVVVCRGVFWLGGFVAQCTSWCVSGDGIVHVGWIPACAANFPRPFPFSQRFKSNSCPERVSVPVFRCLT